MLIYTRSALMSSQIGGDWQQKFYGPDALVFVVDSTKPELLAVRHCMRLSSSWYL